jgi:ribonuclease HI
MQREGGLRSRNGKWLWPEAGRLKIKVDGAFRDTDKNGGWGYVIRDDEGRVIQSGSGRHRFAYSPLHMELCDCIEGVRAAEALGVGEIILETNATQVVEALLGDEFSCHRCLEAWCMS